MDKSTGRIFNIQRFSVHDGPGIRTTVFMKGCNLRCAWCHNPESYSPKQQIRYQQHKCVECGMCERICPKGVYIRERQRMNEEECILCGKCAEECLYGALQVWGEDKSAEEVMNIVRRDIPYFQNSGGGLTVSGGEPLLQPEFVSTLFINARKEGIHTALDTAGNVPYEAFEKVLPYTDLVLLDLKSMDAQIHKQYTGVTNKQILENAERLFKSNVPVQIRVPVIKGINDSLENARKLKEFIKDYQEIQEVKLLPYHSMGICKAEQVRIDMRCFASPDDRWMEQLREILKR